MITIHYGYVKITWDVPTILHSLSIFISKSEIFGYFRSILLGLMEFELTNDVWLYLCYWFYFDKESKHKSKLSWYIQKSLYVKYKVKLYIQNIQWASKGGSSHQWEWKMTDCSLLSGFYWFDLGTILITGLS